MATSKTTAGTTAKTAGSAAGNRLDISNWTALSDIQAQNPKKPNVGISFLQALGIPASYIRWPTPTASLGPAAAAAAQDTANQQNPGQQSQQSQNVQPSKQSQQALTKTEAANKALGQRLASKYNWSSGAEWTALNNLVMSESGWNNLALNPTSGAFGIAQALPASKYPKAAQPSSLGGAANAQAQIEWMLQYIKSAYGDPINAWAFHLKKNYY